MLCLAAGLHDNMSTYSYVRDFEGADIRVNGESLIHAHLYEQMPAESQFEETIFVTRNANKYSFDFKLGFRSRCEREGVA